MTRTRHPRLADVRSVGLKTIMKRAPLGLIGCFSAGLMSSAFYTMGPVFCQQLNLSVSQLSSFMTITVLGGLLFQWPLGTISDRCDRSIVIPVLGGLFAIISGLMILASQHSFGLFMAGASLFGGLMFSIYPVAVARTHDMFEPRDVVTVSSALLLFHGIGSMMGPMVSSSVMVLLDNPSGFFVYFSATGMMFTAVSFLLRQNEFARIIPVENQVDFRIINHTSQIALQIDPRQKNNVTEVAVKKDHLYTQSPV